MTCGCVEGGIMNRKIDYQGPIGFLPPTGPNWGCIRCGRRVLYFSTERNGSFELAIRRSPDSPALRLLPDVHCHNEENMVKLFVRDRESIQEAVRRFRKLVERTGIKKEMRKREYYEKPSMTKRRSRLRAERRARAQRQTP